MRGRWFDVLLFILAAVLTSLATYLICLILAWNFRHEQSLNVAEWLAAVFTGFAAFTALFIATRDRTDRKKERLAADQAQAKLVMLDMRFGTIRDGRPAYFVFVVNHGAQPILDLRLGSARMAAYPDAQPHLSEWQSPILIPGEKAEFLATFTEPDGLTELPPRPGGATGAYPELSTLGIECWVRFADARGTTWEKSTGHSLRRSGRITDQADS